MMNRILYCFFVSGLFIFVPFVCFAETPEFRHVPMELLQIRDGVGNVFEKLSKGETVKIAYLGGSITAANGWRPKTTEWFKKTFSNAKIEEIHAAIGGTGSDLGVFRIARDVLQYQPDLLFVEFAVNDGGALPEKIWRSMEGIVRQTWKANPKTDIVFVYTISEALAKEPREGICNRSMSSMELLADFYGIPSINFTVPVLALEKSGKLLFKGESAPEGVILFSKDSVHPLDAGHQIYVQAVIESFEKMKGTKPVSHQSKLAKTFISDHWETAQLVPITESMLQGEWKKLDADNHLQKSFGQRLGAIWYSGKPGSQLTFKFKGSQAKIYDLVGPNGGQVIVTVDGKTKEKPVARFDSYCTYHRLATLDLASNLDADVVHTITVEVHPEQPNRQPVAFRLKDPEKELAEPKFQGTSVWFGQLMLIGNPVD
ncbi:MAG: SGNH/GDSL hydrolase family protein [Planctomycetaceae bacterium]|jgi:lysophospholipase L1-like esterase|nr:SGNH/GDSL hydrolase family protein [Planctomycetaceae bacterium]